MVVATRETTVEITRHRFTADDYQLMGEAGIFHPNARVELIEGEIIEMFPIGAGHIGCIGLTNMELTRQLQTQAIVFVQCPIRIADDGEPQPDLLIVRKEYDRTMPPTPADTFLLIEVSENSLRFDRTIKLPLYAAAGIPESWIFDMKTARIERHTEPRPGGYATIKSAGAREELASTTLPGLTISVDEVLGLPPTTLSRSGQ